MIDIIHRRGARALTLIVAATLAAGIAIPVGAMPTDPPVAGKAQDEDAQQKPQKMSRPTLYCEMHTVTGSRLPQKVCKTRKEWIDEVGVDPATLDRR